MKIVGKITAIGKEYTFTKADGTEHRKQYITIEETRRDSHNDSVALALVDTKIDTIAGIKIGDSVKCLYDIDARISEDGEKAYNDARVFVLEPEN